MKNIQEKICHLKDMQTSNLPSFFDLSVIATDNPINTAQKQLIWVSWLLEQHPECLQEEKIRELFQRAKKLSERKAQSVEDYFFYQVNPNYYNIRTLGYKSVLGFKLYPSLEGAIIDTRGHDFFEDGTVVSQVDAKISLNLSSRMLTLLSLTTIDEVDNTLEHTTFVSSEKQQKRLIQKPFRKEEENQKIYQKVGYTEVFSTK